MEMGAGLYLRGAASEVQYSASATTLPTVLVQQVQGVGVQQLVGDLLGLVNHPGGAGPGAVKPETLLAGRVTVTFTCHVNIQCP